jgi:hypothetical protein
MKKSIKRLYYAAVDRTEALRGIENSIRLMMQLAYRCKWRANQQWWIVNVRCCENV